MFLDTVSRRQFFTHLVAAGTGSLARLVTTVAPVPETLPPQHGWVIVELGWEYNDEYTYSEGEFLRTQLYLDKAAAEADKSKN